MTFQINQEETFQELLKINWILSDKLYKEEFIFLKSHFLHLFYIAVVQTVNPELNKLIHN